MLLLIIVSGLVLGFLWKFILRPYYYMLKYSRNKGVQKLGFIPIVGPFGLLKSNLQKYGDCFHDAKISFQTFPRARAITFNLADRAAISILDPQLIQDYFRGKQDNYVKYQLTYKNKARVFGNGVAFAEGNQWKKRRVVTTALMNFDFFEIILPKINRTAARVINELEYKNGVAKFNALEFSSKIAGESIVECFFGADLHDIKFHGESISPAVGRFVSEVGNLDQQLLIFLFGAGIVKLGLTQNHRNINRKINEMRAFGRELVESKIKSAETDKDMNFIKYIKSKGYLNPQNETHLSPEEVLDEFLTFFVGGMDTTAHLLHMCLYYLAIHPKIQESLRSEIEGVGEDPDIPTINKLKNLDNFITEANRHYGFINTFFPREAIKDHMLGDIQVYKGTILIMGWLQNFYNQQYFSDPRTFNPDRWNTPLESHFIFTPFSAGKRTCIGKNIALIEIKLVLIKLLKECRLKSDPNYNLRLVYRSLYEPEEPIYIQAEKLQ